MVDYEPQLLLYALSMDMAGWKTVRELMSLIKLNKKSIIKCRQFSKYRLDFVIPTKRLLCTCVTGWRVNGWRDLRGWLDEIVMTWCLSICISLCLHHGRVYVQLCCVNDHRRLQVALCKLGCLRMCMERLFQWLWVSTNWGISSNRCAHMCPSMFIRINV